jgi:hypothetical protein
MVKLHAFLKKMFVHRWLMVVHRIAGILDSWLNRRKSDKWTDVHPSVWLYNPSFELTIVATYIYIYILLHPYITMMIPFSIPIFFMVALKSLI